MSDTKKESKPKCGIVMPISKIDDYCNEEHWQLILRLIEECAEECGFEPNLVSNKIVSQPIQKDIIFNLSNDDLVICDISCGNPNVMFELGLRLAFDKPTIIIKDDITNFSFDLSPIRHTIYSRNLRFDKVVKFKKDLIEIIKGTYEEYLKDKENYSTYLKHFGTFKKSKIEVKEVPEMEMLKDDIEQIKRYLANDRDTGRDRDTYSLTVDVEFDPKKFHMSDIDKITDIILHGLPTSMRYKAIISNNLGNYIRFFVEDINPGIKQRHEIKINLADALSLNGYKANVFFKHE